MKCVPVYRKHTLSVHCCILEYPVLFAVVTDIETCWTGTGTQISAWAYHYTVLLQWGRGRWIYNYICILCSEFTKWILSEGSLSTFLCFMAWKVNYLYSFFRSLGLAIPPRIRFLQRLEKQKRGQTLKAEYLAKHSDSSSLHNLSVVEPQDLNTNSSLRSDEKTEEEQDTALKKQPFSFWNGMKTFAPVC